ncbi:hypothetical protein GCM10023091_33090 [Ravibacter arvi]|uniref:Right handed beta helix domain-containing protein n=1 Tax=Ravibacter arvi TaxID=2051041 RepID=A0ABP8M6E5_9BACT
MTEIKTSLPTRRNLLAALGVGVFSTGVAKAAAPDTGAEKKQESIKTLATFTALLSETTLQPGTLVETLGYYEPGDTGGAIYKITRDTLETDAGQLPTGHSVRMLPGSSVNYRMFGARADGKSDDGIAIKKAHHFANLTGTPVVNASGSFWVGDTRSIPVQTDVHWGSTVFHLDESKNVPREPHFEVLPAEGPMPVRLSAADKAALVKQLRPGAKLIPELAAYKNCLIIVKDETDRIGRRFGVDYSPKGWAKEEFFYVEEFGRVIGDIAWVFSDYTELTAYPCDKSYLTIEGGVFLLSGDNPGAARGPYHDEGITVRRSRTIIRNQWVGLEKGRSDISMTPRSGFYSFSHTYDILLENVRLIPWEKNRPGTDRDLWAGTYGIGGSRVLSGTFRNITAEGSPIHWGVFGTNLYKNFRIENCRLNRVDVHFHGWNITIKDSEIGANGLTLTGGGELLIENTRVFNNVFLNLRQDYGAKWDGPIRISNSRMIPQNDGPAWILSMLAGDFDYGYPVVFGRQIVVNDFVADSREEWSNARYNLIRLPKFSKTKEGLRLVFPDHTEFRNVRVHGRARGFQLLDLPDVSSFLNESRKGGDGDGTLKTNANLIFENIALDDDPDVPNLRIDLPAPYADDKALYPFVRIIGCDYLNVELGSVKALISIDLSIVRQFRAGGPKGFEGRIFYDRCRFQGSVPGNSALPMFLWKTRYGISFTNCEINLPLQNGKPVPEYLDRLEMLSVNGVVRFNHLNTRLGGDILNHLSKSKTRLNRKFLEGIRNHHELEDD